MDTHYTEGAPLFSTTIRRSAVTVAAIAALGLGSSAIAGAAGTTASPTPQAGPQRDELSGETYPWGRTNYVRLTPGNRPAHVLTVLRPSSPPTGGSPT